MCFARDIPDRNPFCVLRKQIRRDYSSQAVRQRISTNTVTGKQFVSRRNERGRQHVRDRRVHRCNVYRLFALARLERASRKSRKGANRHAKAGITCTYAGLKKKEVGLLPTINQKITPRLLNQKIPPESTPV